MKRFVIGFICGALIFGGTSVLANSVTMVGKSIQSEVPVYYNGENLAVTAIVVEGASYLPVRVIASTLGAEVNYNDGVIYLTQQQETIKQQIMDEIKIENQKDEIRNEIAKLQEANEKLRSSIRELEKELERPLEENFKEPIIQALNKLEENISKNDQKISDLEARLAELEQQKAELEAQQ